MAPAKKNVTVNKEETKPAAKAAAKKASVSTEPAKVEEPKAETPKAEEVKAEEVKTEASKAEKKPETKAAEKKKPGRKPPTDRRGAAEKRQARGSGPNIPATERAEGIMRKRRRIRCRRRRP